MIQNWISKVVSVFRKEPESGRMDVGEPANGPFSVYDRTTPTWKKVEAHIESRIASLRTKNDTNLDAVETAKLRGRIAELKRLASLGEDRTPKAEE